jgi:hypothetical protein
MKLQLIILFCLSALVGQAQVVTSIPSFFNEASGEIKIIFDASQGNQGLKDFSGDVYAHTGLITNKSTSGSDWKYAPAWLNNAEKYKLRPLGNNKYEFTITPDIRTFYGVTNPTDTILKLAFVFRNSNGSREGKTESGGDIFVDLMLKDFDMRIISPRNGQFFDVGDSVVFSVITSSSNCIISLLRMLNGNFFEIARSSDTNEFKFVYHDLQNENYQFFVQVAVNYGEGYTNMPPVPLNINVRSATVFAPLPEGVIDGINIDKQNNSVILVLRVPIAKKSIYAIGDFNDWLPSTTFQLKRGTGKDSIFYWIELTDLDPDYLYRFQYLVDESLTITDPYTELVLDPWDDRWINYHSEIYPNMPKYPEGLTSGLVATFQINKPEFVWTAENYVRPNKHDLIIYELLIRDFMQHPNYDRLIDTLDYLQNLGVNAIGLLPNYEFDGNDSWGYNPNHMFAVDKAYGSAESFKRFVDECHKRGIAVIMDIVLNHQTGSSPLARLYWEGNNTAVNNPWFTRNVHDFNVFHKMNHQSEHTVYFARRVAEFWMKEFRIDGYRFDLSKGFTATNNDEFFGFLERRIVYWQNYSDYMWSIDPDFYVILEHLGRNNEETRLANHGMMLWGNLNWAYSQLAQGQASGSSLTWQNEDNRGAFATGANSRGWNYDNLIVYAESHDEERVSYRVKTWGRETSSYSTRHHIPHRMALAWTFLAPLPGPKMIWQFGELAYDYSIFYCYNPETGQGSQPPPGDDRCKTARKPLVWHYLDHFWRAHTYYVYGEMNKFRLYHPAFQNQKNFSYQTAGGNTNLLRWIIAESNIADSSMVIVGNFDVEQRTITIPNFPANGIWYNHFGGDSIILSENTITISLEPGYYKVFTKVRNEKMVSVQPLLKKEIPMIVYPNPAKDEVFVEFEDENWREIILHDLHGKVLRTLKTREKQMKIDVSILKSGLYIITVSDGVKISSQRIVVK